MFLLDHGLVIFREASTKFQIIDALGLANVIIIFAFQEELFKTVYIST